MAGLAERLGILESNSNAWSVQVESWAIPEIRGEKACRSRRDRRGRSLIPSAMVRCPASASLRLLAGMCRMARQESGVCDGLLASRADQDLMGSIVMRLMHGLMVLAIGSLSTSLCPNRRRVASGTDLHRQGGPPSAEGNVPASRSPALIRTALVDHPRKRAIKRRSAEASRFHIGDESFSFRREPP